MLVGGNLLGGAMIRLLLVDDEALVLRSLERRLRREEGIRAWTASSVDEALGILKKESINVVLTDLRMPGRDGHSLLSELQRRWPDVIRLVLSGHIARQPWMTGVPLAHGFLSKPCTWEEIQGQIRRAAATQERLVTTGVAKTVDRLGALPPVPDLFRQLTEAVADPKMGTTHLATIVEAAPSIAAQVLRIANSAWLGLPRQVEDIREALNFLGLDLVRKLALSAEVFSDLGRRGREAGLDPRALQEHAVLVARIASRLVPEQDAAATSTAGVLHKVGVLALAAAAPTRWARAEQRRLAGASRVEAERREFGCTHADVGAYLLNRWGIPLRVVEAIAFQHTPPTSVGGPLDVAGAVYVANGLANALASGRLWTMARKNLDAEWLARRDNPSELERWCLLAESQHQGTDAP